MDKMNISRWKFVLSVIYRPWKGWVGFLFGVISIYDLFISQFIDAPIKNKLPVVADLIKIINWPWYIWTLLFLILLVVFIFEGAYRYISNSLERPELQMLNQLRVDGVQLRNRGISLLSEKSVEDWIETFEDWNTRVVDTVNKLSPSKAGYIKTLNRWKYYTSYPNAYNEQHGKILIIFDEKLRRLEEIIYDLSSK